MQQNKLKVSPYLLHKLPDYRLKLLVVVLASRLYYRQQRLERFLAHRLLHRVLQQIKLYFQHARQMLLH